MDDIRIKALYNRINAGDMTIEQVPEPYKLAVQELISNKEN